MRRHLTGKDIANAVRMTRSLHHGAILIVEGDRDIRVYGRLTDSKLCRLIPGHGKNNTVDALMELETSGVQGILAIADSDFWKLDNFKPPSTNLLLTDTHDLETMVLSSDALEKVLDEFGSRDRIHNIGKPIRDMLLQSALPIGILRWISSPTQENLNLKFDGLPFDTFVDRTTLIVDIDALVKALKINSNNISLDETRTKNRLDVSLARNFDPCQACSGHDLVEILTIGLVNSFGNNKARSLSSQQVDSILRLAYGQSQFSSTQLRQSILNWEKTHSPYKVLL